MVKASPKMPPDYIRHYAKILRDLYLQMPPFPQRDWPPIRATEATKLVVVYQNASSEFKTDTFEHDYAHGKIDNVHGHKNEVELDKILDPVDDKKSPDNREGKTCTKELSKPPKVVMDGAPGVGKTTLTIKMCSGWARGQFFEQYELVILIPLRQAEYRNARELKELFRNCHDQKVIDYIISASGENVVFIFDGYDELTYEQREETSIFLKVIRGDVLPNCAVVVTSRPYASSSLHQMKSINRHIEVLGFKTEQIYTCVRQNLEDKDIASKLIGQLKEREDIASLCYIPLNCVIMIYIYRKSKTQALPTTMTELFCQFVCESVKREVHFAKKDPTLRNKVISSLDKLPRDLAEQLQALERIAYRNLIKDQFVFNYEDITSESVLMDKLDDTSCLGLVTSIPNVISDSEEHRFQFLHLSVQEFLAARYASKAFHDEKQIDLLRMYINQPRFRLFLLFYAGIIQHQLSSDNARILFRLERKRCKDSKQWITRFLDFVHVIYESRHFDLFNHLFELFCDKDALSLKDYKLSQFDCKILAHFFCSIQHKWNKLDLQNCSLNAHSLHVFDQVYQTTSTGIVEFESIDFSSNSPGMIDKLELFPWLRSVKEFKFHCKDSCPLTGESLNLRCLAHIPIIDIVQHGSETNANGMHVVLTDSKIKIQHNVLVGEHFVNHFQSKKVKCIELTGVDNRIVQSVEVFLPTVETFTVHGVANMDMWIIQSALVLSQSKNLHSLTLYNSGLTYYGAACLFKSLQSNASIKTLNISCNPEICSCPSQCEEVGFWLETMLSVNKSLTKIQMCNTVSDWLAQFLIAGILKNSTLESLDVDSNYFSVDTIQGIIDASLNNSKISELHIEGYVLCKLGSKFQEFLVKFYNNQPKLFCALAHINTLQSSYSSITNLKLGKDLDNSTLLRSLQILQCNISVKKLTIDFMLDSYYSRDFVGCALERLLVVNNVLEELICTFSDLICKPLVGGLSKNTSLQGLSLKLYPTCSNSSVIHILKVLQQNDNVKKLEIDFSDCHVTDDTEIMGSAFEQYLKTNSTLLELTLKMVNEAVAFKIAMGLHDNRCLKNLKCSLYSLTSFGIAELLLSIHNGVLSELVIHEFCSLHRVMSCKWNLVIFDVYLMWPQLQYVFEKQEEMPTFQINSLKLFTQHAIERLFMLNAYQHLKSLDFSNVRCECDHYELEYGKVIGFAFQTLLTTSSVEVLTFKSCTLPDGVWTYLAKGLMVNKSVKTLNLSKAHVTVNDAICILDSLQVNQTLQELDLSENLELKLDSSRALSDAITGALACNTTLRNINFKNSLSDSVAQKLANALQKNTGVRKLEISEESLNFSSVQQLFVLLDRTRSKRLHLQFNEVILPNDNEELCQYLIKIIVGQKNAITQDINLLDKFFYGLCGFICSQRRDTSIQFNLTELVLSDVDSEAAIILFQTLSLTKFLSLVSKLSLKGNAYRLIAGTEVGGELKTMLVHNKTLHELILGLIDDTVVISIADGLQHNCTLLKMSFEYYRFTTLNNHVIANLLHSMSKNVSLVEVNISDLPPIVRASKSSWTVQVSSSHSTFLPHFICCLCEIHNGNVSPNCSMVESLLKSLSVVKQARVDTQTAIKLFKSLAFNTTCEKLDLSENEGLVNSRRSHDLCEAIKTMLTKNGRLESLNMSGSLNNTTAEGLIAGLEKNKTLRHLCIDANLLKVENISKIIHLTCVSGLVSLTVTDIFVLSKVEDSQLWEINVLDELLWSYFVTVLAETSPSFKLINALNRLTTQKCICNTTKFDLAGKELQFAMHFGDNQPVSMILHKLASLRSLKYLTLCECELTDNECNDIVTGILKQIQLKKLDISCNMISAYGMIELINSLKCANELEELDLSVNIDDEYSGCHDAELGLAYETLLKEQTVPLKILNLSTNNISDVVCMNIGSGIQRNNVLLCLDLSYNDITITGMKALLQSLEYNHCLQMLDVSNNSPLTIDTCVDQRLCKVLKETKTTLKINCKIDGTTLDVITAGIPQQVALTKFFLQFQSELDLSCELKDVKVFNLDYFSLTASNSELKIEIFSAKIFPNNLELVHLEGLNEVVISNHSTIIVLNFSKCNFICCHLNSILQSLQQNEGIFSLSLGIRNDFTLSETAVLGSTIKTMLTMNHTIRHLELCGAVDDQIANGIKEGMLENHSIELVSIEVSHLTNDSVLGLLHLLLKSQQIGQVKLHPKIELSKVLSSSCWMLDTCTDNKQSPGLTFFSQLQVGRKSNIQKFVITSDIDDILAVALFSYFEDNRMTNKIKILGLSCRILDNTGKDVNHALEKMIKQNNALQQITLPESLNDSMGLAVAKGLLENQSLQRLDIYIASLSDDVLNQLLQSLSYTPLAIICWDTCEQIFSFVRCSSTSMLQQNLFFSKSQLNNTRGSRLNHFSQLGRVLFSISNGCTLQQLVIYAAMHYLQHRLVRHGIQEMLTTCTALKVLKIYWPITTSIVKALATGLVGNKTLCSLELDRGGMRISTFRPIFMSLNSCALANFQFIYEFTLQREPATSRWSIIVITLEDKLFKNLCEIYRYNIKIDTIIQQYLEPRNNYCFRRLELQVPAINIEMVRILLRSIGAETFPVYELILNSVIDGSDLGIGSDIERALKCKSLKKLRVNSDMCLTNNLLVQCVFKLDFTSSEVCCIEVGNDLLLERVAPLRTSYHMDDFEYYKTVEFIEIVPWRVTIINKDILVPLFTTLNQICPSYPCLCHSVLQYLNLSSEYSVAVTTSELIYNVPKFDLSRHSFDKHGNSAFSSLNGLDLTKIASIKVSDPPTKRLPCKSSLKLLSLSIDSSSFDMIEELIYSFLNSDVYQLEVKDICILHRNEDFCFVNLKNNYPQFCNLLHTWRLFTILSTIHRHIPDLTLSLRAGICNGLPLNIFRKLFWSLKEIRLDFTPQGRELLISIIELLQASTTLTHFCFFYDSKLSSGDEQSLGCAFEKLFLWNTSVKVIKFTGQLSDEIVIRIAQGLMHNGTLQTLQLKVSSLTVSTLASLLKSVNASNLADLHITDGCIVHRNQDSHYDVKFSGNNLLLCQLFCASVRAQNYLMGFQEALAPGGKLKLVQHPGNTLLRSVFTAIEEGNMSELILSGCNVLTNSTIHDVAIRDLLSSRTSKLQVLQLHKCKISDSECIQIAYGLTTNEKLKSLDLSSNEITSCGAMKIFESLLENYTLQELNISDNKLSTCVEYSELSSSENALEVNTSLSQLHLGICNSLCQYIATGLPTEGITLRVLSMQITDEEQIVRIFNSLQFNDSVKELNLSHSLMNTCSVGSAVGQMLKHNETLNELILHECKISDKECKLIAEGLAQNKCLTKLDLSNNWLCGQGIVAIFKCLPNNWCCLSNLDLSCNHETYTTDTISLSEIKTVSFSEVKHSLANSAKLKALKVSDLFCRTSKRFQRGLFKGLQQNFTLEKLDISKNFLDANMTCAFSDMLSQNTSLTELNVRWCTFTPRNLKYLAKSLTHNPNCRIISDPLTKITLDLSGEHISNIHVPENDKYSDYCNLYSH